VLRLSDGRGAPYSYIYAQPGRGGCNRAVDVRLSHRHTVLPPAGRVQAYRPKIL